MTDVLLTTAAAAGTIGFVWKDLVPLAPALVALGALWFSDISNKRTLAAAKENAERAATTAKETAEAAAWQKANETELKVIQERLDAFFGPYRTKSEVNKLLNRDLRDRQPDAKSFILIEKLFDKAWRDSRPVGEQTMLEEIAANAQELREFIDDHVGMVDAKVMPWLARVSAHYRILELAYAKKLGDSAVPWKDHYVFPVKIEEVLRLEVERLERRRDYLRAHPFEPSPPMPPLDIPFDLPPWPFPPRETRPELTAPVA